MKKTQVKKPCKRCGHGISIHYTKRTRSGEIVSPCRYPGCKCKDFIESQKAA